jgi:hypothetical protein
MSFSRKLSRKQGQEKQKYYDDVKSEAKKIAANALGKAVSQAESVAYERAANEAMAKILAVSAEIIYNDWSKLQKKDTRLKEYVALMNEKLQQVNEPSEKQLEIEKMLYEQCGIKFER